MTTAFALVFGMLGLTIAGNLLYLARHRPRARGMTPGMISVLIPARNEEQNIPRLLDSILSQDHPDFEVLIYDDGSEDGTRQAIDRFADDSRLRVFSGDGPPPGWVGKVHALYQLSCRAEGKHFIFLDADVELTSPDALRSLSAHYSSLEYPAVLTALPRLRGGGLLMVSLVPHIILMMLPWFLVRRVPMRRLGALNGQCWMIDAATYRRLAPHAHHRDEVLEDVQIGRYLKANGVTPVMADVRSLLDVHMYRDLRDAWEGLTKNAYLIVGGHPLALLAFLASFAAVAFLAPTISLWFLLALFVLKGVTDVIGRFPVWITVLMPLSYLLAAAVLITSTAAHLTGTVSWKGRNVAPAREAPART